MSTYAMHAQGVTLDCRMIGRTGINYGDTFRMVKRVCTSDSDAMMRCAHPAKVSVPPWCPARPPELPA